MPTGTITGIFVYPIKSCAGISLSDVICDSLGLQNDRNWLLLDSEDKVLTQRTASRMSLIQPGLDASGNLTLSGPGMTPLAVPPETSNTEKRFELWQDSCVGQEQGEDANGWLSEFLKIDCRLIRSPSRFSRNSRYGKSEDLETKVVYADCCPISIVSEESLLDLNKHLDEPAAMSRFRPSLVIRGLGAYGEESVTSCETSEVSLLSVKPCVRCAVVSVDQESGILSGAEPLKTLSKLRNRANKVVFGQYFTARHSGRLQVGSALLAQ